jgi:hypothetical protein
VVQRELTVMLQKNLFNGMHAWRKYLSCSSSIDA